MVGLRSFKPDPIFATFTTLKFAADAYIKGGQTSSSKKYYLPENVRSHGVSEPPLGHYHGCIQYTAQEEVNSKWPN